jgi:hypothetical protein
MKHTNYKRTPVSPAIYILGWLFVGALWTLVAWLNLHWGVTITFWKCLLLGAVLTFCNMLLKGSKIVPITLALGLLSGAIAVIV